LSRDTVAAPAQSARLATIGYVICKPPARYRAERGFGGVINLKKDYALAFGRALLSSLFIWEGVLQLRDPFSVERYFASVHVPYPDIAILFSIMIHLAAGFSVLIGFMTPWVAGVLALLCLGTAFGVHLQIGDAANMLHFYKNLTMAGGFIYAMVFGAGSISIDEMIGTD
jgi:putative oxidoreductase